MEQQLLEAQLLYSVCFTPEWGKQLVSSLEEEDFFYYHKLFQAIKNLIEREFTIDYTVLYSVEKSIKNAALLVMSEENMGITIIPYKKIFEERLELLKELSAKRQINESFTNELDLDLLKEKLEKIYKKGSARWLSGEDIANLAEDILKNKEEISTTYGLSLFDKATGGLQKGQYIIVAGRPSIGKSAFLQYVGLKNAEKGKKVLFVSVEMSEEMIIRRILSTYQPSMIPPTFNILIAGTLSTIEAEIQKKARDFDLILVDYIQLLHPKTKTRDMYERVTNISSELKSMATRFNIPFMCASQFSRKAEGNQPNLADLKESGALEQDADVVLSLWKHKGDDDLNIHENMATVRVDLLKNRNGWTFSNSDIKQYSIMFVKNEFRFYDIEMKVKE